MPCPPICPLLARGSLKIITFQDTHPNPKCQKLSLQDVSLYWGIDLGGEGCNQLRRILPSTAHTRDKSQKVDPPVTGSIQLDIKKQLMWVTESLEDTLQKYTLQKYTLQKYTLNK